MLNLLEVCLVYAAKPHQGRSGAISDTAQTAEWLEGLTIEERFRCVEGATVSSTELESLNSGLISRALYSLQKTYISILGTMKKLWS